MNPDQLPTVSTFRVEKPGKSKFAPSIGGRKSQTTSTSTSTPSPAAVPVNRPEIVEETTFNDFDIITPNLSFSFDDISTLNDNEIKTPSIATSAPGKKIESIQSRRSAQKDEQSTQAKRENQDLSHVTHNIQQQVRLPSGPKDAASIPTTTLSTGITGEKRTMSYFLKDTGEGREMPGSNGLSLASNTEGSLSPSKTRRIVNLRNIKAPPRSSATSTALAPQVRVVNGVIVYDEKFSAALSSGNDSANKNSLSDLEQELEFIDEDDENGKHLTSATYSTKIKGSNRWNQIETDLFYEALQMCGTDFSMIQTLFPHRTRSQIKGKYKLEEKANPIRINNSIRIKKPFDSKFKDRVKEFTDKK